MRHTLPLLPLLLVVGCATKGQVQLVERQVATLRAQSARQDSARAAELDQVLALQQRILDSLRATRESLRRELGQELLEVQQQLVQVQELTGQSQRRLAELKRQMDDRTEQLAAAEPPPAPPVPATIAAPTPTPAAPTPGADTSAAPATPTVQPVAPAPTGGAPTPDQLYQGSLQEFRRGAVGVARGGFREFLRTYPTHPQAADALYFVAETFAADQPDSAAFYYRQVVERHRTSERAATALYKTGLIAERAGDRLAAREIYDRVVSQYARSREAELARDRLTTLRP